MAFQRAEDALDQLLVRLQGGAFAERPAIGVADRLLAIVCACAAVAVAVWSAGQLGDPLYTEGSFNLWFGADHPRVAANLLDSSSYQYRANVHPIFPILFTPWASALANLLGSPLAWGRAIVFGCAAISTGVVYLALRCIALPRLPALLFVGVFLTSAGFLHWYSAIEIAPFSGLSASLAVLALAYGPTRNRVWWVLMSAFSLGMTITNWSAGLAATIARWRLRPAITISIAALIVVGVLAVIQRLVFPTAGVFFNPFGLMRESEYAGPSAGGWSPFANLRASLIYTQVSPRPVLERIDGFYTVTNQHQGFETMGLVGLGAALAWALLLLGGAIGAVRSIQARPVAFGLALMLAGQVALSLVYGDQTFLYATNILPMLVVLAAFSWFLHSRAFVAVLAGIVVIVGGANNAAQFARAASLAQQAVATGGNPVWSRFQGDHVLLPLKPERAPPR